MAATEQAVHHGRKPLPLPRVPPVQPAAGRRHLTQIMTDTLSMARAVTRHSIRAAAGRIARISAGPRCCGWPGPISACRIAVTLKLELLQASGSFKPRGAFNTMLSTGSQGPCRRPA